ncbi:MAG: hypothetical protein DMG57_26790 [Acidobacteria bacterium]|nr:MAG: hypothetical protein DMG57_26790 [Acidobacteriota bacterium]
MPEHHETSAGTTLTERGVTGDRSYGSTSVEGGVQAPVFEVRDHARNRADQKRATEMPAERVATNQLTSTSLVHENSK